MNVPPGEFLGKDFPRSGTTHQINQLLVDFVDRSGSAITQDRDEQSSLGGHRNIDIYIAVDLDVILLPGGVETGIALQQFRKHLDQQRGHRDPLGGLPPLPVRPQQCAGVGVHGQMELRDGRGALDHSLGHHTPDLREFLPLRFGSTAGGYGCRAGRGGADQLFHIGPDDPASGPGSPDPAQIDAMLPGQTPGCRRRAHIGLG